MDQKKVKGAAILGVIFGIFIIYAVGSSVLYNTRKDTFKALVEHSLNTTYGEAIDELYINSGSVGVYVDPVLWKNTDDETKKEWTTEVALIVRQAGIDSELIKHTAINIAFYDDVKATHSMKEYSRYFEKE